MKLVDKINSLINKKNNEKSLSSNQIDEFQINAEKFLLDYMMKTDYKTYENLLKEIIYLVHYTFEVLKDDCLIGKKIMESDMTKIDKYIFSKYRRDENLKENIENIILVAYSNRFEEDPHENLFAYYVFLEESGLEIINLFNDFYDLVETGKLNERSKNLAYTSDKEILMENIKNKNSLESETLMTEVLSIYHSPIDVQEKIIKNKSVIKEIFGEKRKDKE